MRTSTAAGVGARLLGEVEETSLDEVLASLRAHFATTITTQDDANQHNVTDDSTTAAVDTFPFAPLNRLANLHFRATRSPTLAITGRCHRDLLYPLIATLIAPPHEKAVAIIDCEGCFDPLRLLATRPYEDVTTPVTTNTSTTVASYHHTAGAGMEGVEPPPTAIPHIPGPSLPAIRPRPNTTLRPSDLEHVHILRPPTPSTTTTTTTTTDLSKLLVSLQSYMLYTPHRSRAREWWGTIVISSSSSSSTSSSSGHSSSSIVQGYGHGHGHAQRYGQGQVAVMVGERRGWLRVERMERTAEESLEEGKGVIAEGMGTGWVASSPWGSSVILSSSSE
ncbi:hypothetical protein VTJ49DRAFT_5537 [Mycothermus thermophilus]|uniref:DNA recombination and repair protein Rad51-like C-terminal domain-containing protein n=1 Tax=Humicola insolens TaxID=85995 RepID=A0ABR3V341_HUMIN